MAHAPRQLGPAAAVAALAALLSLAAPAGAVVFHDVAVEEGVAFQRAGDRDNDDPSFIEIMGGGACWLDYDNDGYQDLYLVNGWYNETALSERHQPRSVLYRNLGPGPGPDFREATDAAGVGERGWTQGCAAADYDADGWEDLLVYGRGIQSLYRNRGDGTFANVSASAGITAAGKCPDQPCWGAGAAWADYDRDGCLDLYVINFVEFDMLEGGGNRGPGGHDGQPSQLYRNRCDGTFEDVTEAAGADGDPGPDHSKNWGVVWLDYDLDGWLDLYIASDGVPNILYRNNGDGTFTDKANEALVADPRNGMGAATGDCDEDGDEELFFTHYKSLQEAPWWGYDGFYTNNANGTFTDRSGHGELNVTMPYVKWGVGWEDFDNDGDQDIHVATGHTENVVADADMPHLFWLGDGACSFFDARAASGPGMRNVRMARGSAYADHDLDGDVDMVVVNIMDEWTELLRASGAGTRWLTIELRDDGGNARGVGAEVDVALPGGKVLQRRMNPYQSIHSSNPAQVHVGLGDADRADVTVRWPDTWEAQTFPGLAAGQVVRLHRDGRVQNDTLAPVTRLEVQGPPGEPGWWRGPVTVSLAAEDRGVSWASGVAGAWLALDGGPEVRDPAPVALGEGRHTLRVRSEDAEGNREPVRTEALGVDATPPVSAVHVQGARLGGWYIGKVRVALACSDGLSGVERIEWRLGPGPWTRYAGPFDLTRPGAHDFTWRCVDVAGNAEPDRAVPLAIDLGHPETLAMVEGTAGLAGWWTSEVEVRLEAAGGLRAVAATTLSVDGGPPAPYGGPFRLGEGVHTLRFSSTDDVGRVEPEATATVRVDATPPAIRVTDEGPHVDLPDELIVGPRHAVVASAVDGGSGVASLETRRAGELFRPAAKPVRFGGEGRHLLEVRAADAAGNHALLARDVVLDLTPPALVLLRPEPQVLAVGETSIPLLANPTSARAVLAGRAPVEAAVGADVSGVARLTFQVDGESVAVRTGPAWRWDWSLPPGRPYRAVDLVVEDRVGNVGRTSFEAWVVGDPTAPLPAGVVPAEVPLAALGGPHAAWGPRPADASTGQGWAPRPGREATTL